MNEEKRAVYNKMEELKSKHEEWGEWLSAHDERLMDGKRVIKELYEDEKMGIMTQKELRKLKHDLAGKHRKDDADLQGGHRLDLGDVHTGERAQAVNTSPSAV